MKCIQVAFFNKWIWDYYVSTWLSLSLLFLIQNINVAYMSKDLILRNRRDGSVTSNGGTAEMASKIFVSRQKLHSSLLPSVIFYGHFNFAGIPRSGRYDRLTCHRKIAACDSQIFPFVPTCIRHFMTALFNAYL